MKNQHFIKKCWKNRYLFTYKIQKEGVRMFFSENSSIGGSGSRSEPNINRFHIRGIKKILGEHLLGCSKIFWVTPFLR